MGKILDALRSLPARLRASKGRALTEAAAYLQTEWRATVGTPGTKRSPARPGSPPHKIKGGLQASLTVVANPASGLIEMRAGKVAQYQDHGTRRMLARPHRGPTLDRCRPRLMQILGSKGK